MGNTTLNPILYAKVLGSSGGGGSITVDDALSSTSENPVQNKIIYVALEGKENAPTVTTVSGTTPTIAAADNTIYEYGTLTSLTISSFANPGKFWIWFTSGATPTTTVGIANFTAEANKKYRIFVENGYATYDSWATS